MLYYNVIAYTNRENERLEISTWRRSCKIVLQLHLSCTPLRLLKWNFSVNQCASNEIYSHGCLTILFIIKIYWIPNSFDFGFNLIPGLQPLIESPNIANNGPCWLKYDLHFWNKVFLYETNKTLLLSTCNLESIYLSNKTNMEISYFP